MARGLSLSASIAAKCGRQAADPPSHRLLLVPPARPPHEAITRRSPGPGYPSPQPAAPALHGQSAPSSSPRRATVPPYGLSWLFGTLALHPPLESACSWFSQAS
ncbi:hypothetical protein HNY73_009087 [Argiope bruennichi]|uniref:Uncharacterized protein n=1 Tax=Argiope bruennichi TaxID=94029 RepID=A0A8T0F8G5_ARGBR|nr:hypothetical protein HNY73_009087 [Argiope bruennichi]